VRRQRQVRRHRGLPGAPLEGDDGYGPQVHLDAPMLGDRAF
jgi:hypothetical protein